VPLHMDPSQQGSQFTPSDASTQLIIGLCAGIASVVGLVMVVESRLSPWYRLSRVKARPPAPSCRTDRPLLVVPLRRGLEPRRLAAGPPLSLGLSRRTASAAMW